MYSFGSGLGYAVKTSNEQVSAADAWGAVYYNGYSFPPPPVFSAVLDSDVKIKTASGLWITQICKNSTELVNYYIINPKSTTGQRADMTFSVFGLLK